MRVALSYYGGQAVKPGMIIVRQCSTKIRPGDNVSLGRDFTIYSMIDGVIKLSRTAAGTEKSACTVAAAEAESGNTAKEFSVKKDIHLSSVVFRDTSANCTHFVTLHDQAERFGGR